MRQFFSITSISGQLLYDYSMHTFGDTPEMLKQPNWDLYPLFYDHETRLFVVGGEELPLDTPALHHRLLFPEGAELDEIAIERYPVLLSQLGRPLTTPRMFTWLKESGEGEVFQRTSDVMREAYSEVESIELTGGHHKKMSPFGFSVELIRTGHATLSVLGNCACLGTDPDGHLVDWHEWETGYAELTFHNIDTPAQFVGLFAGLGHLALECASANER